MKFAMFYLGEYGHALAYACIITTLFLGGWRGPILPPFLWVLIKVVAVFSLIVWLRATLPRLRVDQLMAFAWRGLFPMAIINIVVVAMEVLWLVDMSKWLVVAINAVLAGGLILAWSRLFVLGRGRVEV
jgi:NADH-quinone oxidoreductase subunit H